MPESLLATKLYVPPVRPNLVPRARLLARLDEGLHQNHKLTLVSASAGFGKTTLVSEWVHSVQARDGDPLEVAWLSLDEEDSDPARFLTYLIAALQTVAADAGTGAQAALQSPQPLPIESILTALINEIATLPNKLLLVLDDYHAIEARTPGTPPSVDDVLAFLLEHLPPPLHLVIATREDPPLPLARLRARGQMTELRTADMRFTSAEAAEFLNSVMGLDLSEEEIAALESRTEGWIAGLQLAALALQSLAEQGPRSSHEKTNTAGFIQAFTGSHRFVLDYLLEEVLQHQSEDVRTFLLQTALLDHLNGSLCDAVTGREDGQATLETLERGNLFVVPLDGERRWYRYHHLFTDVLQARLVDEQPERIPTLHRRASAWHEEQGMLHNAVRHALAAEDFERAARLAERAWPATFRTYFQNTLFLGWMRALPDDLIRTRPVLSVGYAWALLDVGELEGAEARLRDAERALEANAPADADAEVLRSLPATIASAYAYIALALGDTPGALKHARRMRELVPERDHYLGGSASLLLGAAYWRSGELEAAYDAIVKGMARLQKTGNVAFTISGAVVLADVRVAQGRIREALREYQRVLQLVEEHSDPPPQGSASLYLGLSELYWEIGDGEAASRHLSRSEALGQLSGLPDWPYRLCAFKARMKEAQGELDGAIELLDEAERLYYKSPLPILRPVAALRARVWLKQGRLDEALTWARDVAPPAAGDVSYVREFEHATLARVLVARYAGSGDEGAIRDAVQILERLLEAAEAGKRMGSTIEILVLQALAHRARGAIPAAVASLEQALALAAPEGYVRTFTDEGAPIAELLQEAAGCSTVPDYVSQLQATFGEAKDRSPSSQPLVEPLSERELDVLHMLRTELNGPEIARELGISLNTLRTHTKNIYGKLGVHSRRSAVRRAKTLGIL